MVISSFEVGKDPDLLAYDSSLHTPYVRLARAVDVARRPEFRRSSHRRVAAHQRDFDARTAAASSFNVSLAERGLHLYLQRRLNAGFDVGKLVSTLLLGRRHGLIAYVDPGTRPGPMSSPIQGLFSDLSSSRCAEANYLLASNRAISDIESTGLGANPRGSQ